MDLSSLIEAEEICRKSSSLEAWLYNFSNWVWQRIGFVRNIQGFKILETTLTQELVIRLYMAAQDYDWRIGMMEAKNERANGNDLEIVIETRCGYIKLPCQAKLLYSGDNYPKMKHEVGGYQQIELLINYAKKEGGIPLYLLYNYSFNDYQSPFSDEIINYEDYGCSIVEAQCLVENFYDKKISKWQIPKFRELHPTHAFPLHQILNFAHSYCSGSPLKTSVKKSKDFRFYTYAEIVNDANWNLVLGEPNNVDTINRRKNLQFDDGVDSYYKPSFDPKYRIILFIDDVKGF